MRAEGKCQLGFPTRIETHGEKGSIILGESEVIAWDVEDVEPPTVQGVNIVTGATDPTGIGAKNHERIIRDFIQAIREFHSHLAHVHVNDHDKRRPGSGAIDFGSIAKALRDKDYDGYISVEAFKFEPDPETITREAIKYLNSVFA